MEVSPTPLVPPVAYLKTQLGHCTGISFTGSTSLAVCQKARIHQHLVFVGYTAHGKTSMGWSFGCLLRLVTSNQGEVLTFCLTSCNIDDRHLVPKLAKELVSKLNGDKCYFSMPLAPTASGHQRARSHHVRCVQRCTTVYSTGPTKSCSA